MGSFGDRLRREREQRGITLDDVALTTKIRAGLLKALEEERFDQLPGGIFNKGFVRAYARHLGIDEDQAVADYLTAAGEVPAPRRPGDPPASGRGEVAEPRIQLVHEEREEPQTSGPLGFLAGLLVLVAVGVAAWFYYHREHPAEVVTEPPRESAPAPAAHAPSPAATAAPQPQTATPAAPVVTPAPKTNDLPAPVTANAQSPTPSGSFTVKLNADEECWVKITADGVTDEVTLPASGQKQISAKEKIVLRVGNAGALNLFFNGRRLPSVGQYGEVRTLSFGPGGLEVLSTPPANPPSAPAPARPDGNPQ